MQQKHFISNKTKGRRKKLETRESFSIHSTKRHNENNLIKFWAYHYVFASLSSFRSLSFAVPFFLVSASPSSQDLLHDKWICFGTHEFRRSFFFSVFLLALLISNTNRFDFLCSRFTTNLHFNHFFPPHLPPPRSGFYVHVNFYNISTW